MQTFFRRISSPETSEVVQVGASQIMHIAYCIKIMDPDIFEMPQVRDSMSGACFLDWAPAVVVLGVHRGTVWEQELCCRDVAVECRQVERRRASGGFPRPVGRCGFRRTMGARPMQRGDDGRPTKERWMLWTSSRSKQNTYANRPNDVVPMSYCWKSQTCQTCYWSDSPRFPRLLHIVFFLDGYGMFWTYIPAILLTSRDRITLHYIEPVGPTLRTQFRTGTLSLPRCIVRDNLQQPNHYWNIIHDWPYLASLSHGVATASLKCVLLLWIDKHRTCYLFSFLVGPKRTWS